MPKIYHPRNLSPTLSIAIIVRTKDRPHLLTRCLQSLVEQKRRPDEVIVVNDGGIPIDDLLQNFSELTLHLIHNETNQGRARAGNQGVQAVQSEVIGFLDDDDRYLPDHLQRLETAMLHFDTQVAYSGCRLVQQDMLGDTAVLREQAIGEFNDPYDAQRLRYENYIPLINLLIDRQLWLEVGGFDEAFEIFEDWDLLARLSARTSFYHVQRLTTEYTIWGSGQITRATDKERWFAAYRQFLEKHLLPLPDAEKIPLLTEYWRISQERRGIMRETTEDKRTLQLQLLQNQQTVEEAQRHLAGYQSRHTQLQHEYAQLQSDWTRKHEQLQADYAKLQSEWTWKYEQSQTDWNKKLEQVQGDWARRHEQLQVESAQVQSDWSRKYELLQTQYASSQAEWNRKQDQLQTDWGRKYEQLQTQYASAQQEWNRKQEQLQADWTRKYEQLQADWARKYEQLQVEYGKMQAEWRSQYEQKQANHAQEIAQIHLNWRAQYEQLQQDSARQYTQSKAAWEQQEAHFKQQQSEMLRDIDRNISLYRELQSATQLDKECCQTLFGRLSELHHQSVLGLTQGTLERVLVAQLPRPCKEDLPPADLWINYQRLVTWVEKRTEVWQEERQRQAEESQQRMEALQTHWERVQEESQELRQALRSVTEKAAKSRWLHYGGYVKALDHINGLAETLWQETCGVSKTPQVLDTATVSSVAEIPPPRPLSGWYPTVKTFASSNTQPQVMEEVSGLGNLPFHLGPATALVFTTYCTLNHFYRFDIALATYMRINACHLRVILREVGATTPLRVMEINALGVLDNGFHTITFAPLEDSAGKTYQIEIDSPDANDENAVAVWCYAVAPPQQWTVPVKKEIPLPTVLPDWLHQGLFDAPLSPRLTTLDEELIFVVGGVGELLRLQVWLRRVDRILEETQKTGRVIVCGEVNEEVRRYCQRQGIRINAESPMLSASRLPAEASSPVLPLFPAEASSPVLPLFPAEASSPVSISTTVWVSDVHVIPQPEMIERVEEVLAACPKAAMVVPLQVQTNGIISAAYALLDQYGNLHNFPVGALANHPSHGYRRVIDAASSTLVVMRQECLTNVAEEVLQQYKTPLYQLTELIWQWRAQGLETVYESAFSYTVEGPLFSLEMSQYEADRQLFCQRWQAELVKQTGLLVSQYALLNPKRLPTVLIIDATLPAYDEDSGSLRLFTLMKMLITLGYRVTFFPDNLDSQFKYCHALEALGVEVFHAPYNITEALTHRAFTFAIVCRVDIGQRYIPFLRLVSPKTRIFYDTVDIHYIRELRQAEIENNPQLAIRAQETRRKELANCMLANCTITVTQDDARHLQEELPQLNYAVIPNVHLLQPVPETSFDEREGLVFIGNYNHQPNEDAVYFFIQEVLPHIHAQLPDLNFYVLGSNMKEKMKSLASDRVKIVGWVDQVEPHFAQRRVFVSYLRYGAGMKGKLGQALSLGLPVVTTSIGAEGMGLQEAETALIADTSEQFAKAVCRLYREKELWEKLSKQGREYIEGQFGEGAVRERLRELLA